jgi:hypothetical protein
MGRLRDDSSEWLSAFAALVDVVIAIIATTNAMPWAGILTAGGILVLSLVSWRGPYRQAWQASAWSRAPWVLSPRLYAP